MALSVLIAIQGSFVSLVLAREVDRFDGARRRLVLAMSAVTLGSSIWAMHFIGMLAYYMPAEVSYDLFLTLLSFITAVLAVGVGYGVMTVIPGGNWRDVAAAVFTGGGICGMHYIGMAALTGPVQLTYEPLWVVTSVLIGIGAAGISLHLGFGTRLQARAALGAVVMGLAISGMHYSAMYGTTMVPTSLIGEAAAHVLDRNLLAIVVAIVAFIICATSMLLLVPPGGRHAAGDGAVMWQRHTVEPAGDIARRGTETTPAPAGQDDRRIPVQAGSGKVMVDPAAIFAVRADGRYTHVQDSEREYFCNLSITELEARLDKDRFFRVHRSHIVQLGCVKSVRRRGDGGVAMVGETAVPVSRSALPKLKARLRGAESPGLTRHEAALLS